jgi:hypothetical protein
VKPVDVTVAGVLVFTSTRKVNARRFLDVGELRVQGPPVVVPRKTCRSKLTSFLEVLHYHGMELDPSYSGP